MYMFDCGRKLKYLENIQTQTADSSLLLRVGWTDGKRLCLPQIVKECNEGVRKMSRTEELINIEKKLEFKCKVS